MIRIIDYRSSQSPAVQYVLQMTNQSNAEKFFVCFQNQAHGLPSGSFPLAWCAQAAAVRTNIYFLWTLTYDFVWAQTGQLQPGVILRPGEVTPARLDRNNRITLTRSPAGAYAFRDQTDGTAGTLFITSDGTIPGETVAVGIGMSGYATQAVQAQPHVAAPYTPLGTPPYYVSFGSSPISTGQVLNVAMLSAIVAIKFPPNMYGAIATLQADNTWLVQYKPYITVAGYSGSQGLRRHGQ
jgi:rhizosphere induced protein